MVSPSGTPPRVRCAAVKLVTWNVNSLNPRMPRVVELLELHQPDLLFVQETKTAPEAFPDLELNAAGYHAVHHSAGRWAGVALAAREGLALDDVCFGLADEPSVDEARWIEATVAGLRAVSVYVPNGREVGSSWYEDKLRFLDAAAARIGELSGGPLAVAGD